jgi:predicted MFS family arabinose efflux permease
MAAIIVAVIGISHTVGNLLFGFLGDRKQVNRLYYSAKIVGISDEKTKKQ